MNSGSENLLPKIAVTIFASGNGTNAENLMGYFKEHPGIYINLLISSNAHAAVIAKAEKFAVPVIVISGKTWSDPHYVTGILKEFQTEYIVLAGFLKLVPPEILQQFPHAVLNIHPALLPKYGGAGMYGKAVHQRVFDQKEAETGITIHEVDAGFDTGAIIFQKAIAIDSTDDVLKIETKVRKLELKFFPSVVEAFIVKQNAKHQQQ